MQKPEGQLEAERRERHILRILREQSVQIEQGLRRRDHPVPVGIGCRKNLGSGLGSRFGSPVAGNEEGTKQKGDTNNGGFHALPE